MDKFVIIDGNNLMFRAFYALPQMTNFNGENSNAVFGFTNMLVKIIKDIQPRYLAVTFDVAKKNFRHERFQEYKGTRKPTPIELVSQFPIIKELLNKMNINMKTEEMMVYEAPQVSVIEVEVEKGFATSTEPILSDFGYGGDLN